MGIGQERFENCGSILGRHLGRDYTGDQRSDLLSTRCHRDTFLVASYDKQGYGGSILPSTHKGSGRNIMVANIMVQSPYLLFWNCDVSRIVCRRFARINEFKY